MSNGDYNWFENQLNQFYAGLFDPTSGFYLPPIIQNGYNDESAGIQIPPWTSASLPDVIDVSAGRPLAGACGVDFENGAATFTGRNNVVTNFAAIGPVSGMGLQFSDNDFVVQVPFSFSTLVINGDLTLVQPCAGAGGNNYQNTYTGTFEATANNPILIATVTLSLGPPVTGRVHPISLSFQSPATAFVFNGKVNDAPDNMEAFWNNLANSPDIIQEVTSALQAGVAGPQAEQWIESIVNMVLAQVPTKRRGVTQ